MRRRDRILRWLGTACLAAGGLLAVGLAWPSPRTQINLEVSGEQAQSGWVSLQSAAASDAVSPVPDLSVAIDLPGSALKGRRERVGLAVDVTSPNASLPVYTLAAEVVSVDATLSPAGESAQALRPATAFGWSLVARHSPLASATLLIRLRRHAASGEAEGERLLLARDVEIPVRTLAGLSAPAATWAAGILGLAGAMIWIAGGVPRTR